MKLRKYILIVWLCFIALQAPKWVKTTDRGTIPPVEVKNSSETVLESLTVPQKAVAAPIATPVDLFDKYFGEKAREARKIAQCESSMNPNADNGIAAGLMQINYKVWLKVFGISKDQLFDPETNIKTSKMIYDRTNSWEAWVSSYKCHKLK